MTKVPAVTTVSRADFLDPDGGDGRFRAMVYDLLAVGARMQDVRDHLAAEMGVTGPQYAILMAVFHLQEEVGGAGVRAVARRLHVSGPFVTAQANRLVAAGLIEKRRNPTDGRGVWLCLSKEGGRRISHAAPVIQQANDAFFENMSKVDFLILSDVAARLEKSADRVGELLKEPQGFRP